MTPPRFRDGEFLPPGGFAPIERPEPRTYLQERMEGEQVSRLYYLDDEPGPTGSYGFAFELTTGGKLIVWATRDKPAFSPYTARLVFRYLEPPVIITPDMARAFSGGRGRDPLAEPPDDLQKMIEGQLIRHVQTMREPTSVGGEQVLFEFSSGESLHLAAVAINKPLPGGKRLLAAIDWVVEGPERARVVIPRGI